MTPLPATLFRSARILTTVAVATALAAACSNATPSPSVTAPPPPTTAATEPGVFPSASTAPATSGPSVAVSVPPLGAAIYVACDAADAGKSCLAPGRYQLSRNVWPVTVTFDVPLGWFEYEGAPGFDGVLLTGPGPDYGGTGWGVLFATVGDVSRDPCDATKGVIPAAQVGNAQNLAAAIAAWPRFKESAPQRITLDGHAGLKVQLTSTNPSSCSSGSLWQTTAGGSMDVYPMINDSGPTAPGTFEIVDTGQGVLVIRTMPLPDRVAADAIGRAADQEALRGILTSIKLTASTESS